MGCFNYVCCGSKDTCIVARDGTGQGVIDGTVYATNPRKSARLKGYYTGSGEMCTGEDQTCIYDVGHEHYFETWGVSDKDLKARFMCPECAVGMPEVSTFEELMNEDAEQPLTEKQTNERKMRARLSDDMRVLEKLVRKHDRLETQAAYLDERIQKKRRIMDKKWRTLEASTGRREGAAY